MSMPLQPPYTHTQDSRLVMPAPVAGIHVLLCLQDQDVDGRDNAHKCPARFVLEEVHGVDSTRFQKVSNQLDTRKEQGRATPEYRFPWDSEACSVGGCGSS